MNEWSHELNTISELRHQTQLMKTVFDSMYDGIVGHSLTGDERRPVRPSNFPCESMPLHNRMLERARRESITDDKARYLVSERLG